MKKIIKIFGIISVFCVFGYADLNKANLKVPNFDPSLDMGYRYKFNPFAKYYESHFFTESLKECYKNMPELFLQGNQNPIIVNLDDNGKLPSVLEKRYYLFYIGDSGYSDYLSGNKQDVLEVGKALKAKYIAYTEETLNKYSIVDGAKVQRKAMIAFYYIGLPKEKFSPEVFAAVFEQKCPLLTEELVEDYRRSKK